MIAFELSNASLASFEASAKYNGFQKALTLHKVILCPRTNLCLTDHSGQHDSDASRGRRLQDA